MPRAGTIHLGGDANEVITAAHEVGRNRMPRKPFVMAVQPSSADPSRAPAGKHVV